MRIIDISRPIDVTSRDGMTESLAVIVRSWVTAVLGVDSDASLVESSASPSEADSTKAPPAEDDENQSDEDTVKEDDGQPSDEEERPGTDVTGRPDLFEMKVAIRQRGRLSMGTKRLLIEAAPAIRVQSSAHPAIFGGDFLAGVRAKAGLFVFAGITFYVRTEDEASGVELKINRYPVKLGSRYAFSLGRVALGPSLALEIETLVKEITLPESGEMAYGNRDSEIEISLVPMLFVTIPVWHLVRVVGAAGAKIPFNEK